MIQFPLRMGFIYFVYFFGGGGATKASQLCVVHCGGLLFLPSCLWFERGKCKLCSSCVVTCGVCELYLSDLPVIVSRAPSLFFSCTNPAPPLFGSSRCWSACAVVLSLCPKFILKVVMTTQPPQERHTDLLQNDNPGLLFESLIFLPDKCFVCVILV